MGDMPRTLVFFVKSFFIIKPRPLARGPYLSTLNNARIASKQCLAPTAAPSEAARLTNITGITSEFSITSLCSDMSCYSTTPRIRNRVNRNHLEICLSSSQKNRNSLAWGLPTKKTCFLGEQYSQAPTGLDLAACGSTWSPGVFDCNHTKKKIDL